MAIFRRDPLTAASNAVGVGKNSDCRRICGYRIDNRLVKYEQQLQRSTVQFTAQTATHQWILFITTAAAWTTTMKRREEKKREQTRTELKLIVRSSKSEAEVDNSRRLRLTYYVLLCIEANYWQTRSIARPLCDSGATCLKLLIVCLTLRPSMFH